MAQLDRLRWQDQLEQAKHDGRVGDDDRERQSVSGCSEMPLKGRKVSIVCQVGIGAANCYDDCCGELGISAGSFDVTDRSAGVRTRPLTNRKRETRPDLGADTLSGTEPAIGLLGKSSRSLLAYS